MKLLKTLALAALIPLADTNAQNCVEIESILVSACTEGGGQEGHNEMLTFRVGPNPLNVADLRVEWAGRAVNFGYTWLGLRQDNETAAKVEAINNTIQACGYLVEPVNGILPANSRVILFTSHLVSPTGNSFAGLTDTLIALFQNNQSQTGGHFLNNLGSANVLQEQVIEFVGENGCREVVTFRSAILLRSDGTVGHEPGSSVFFTPDGTVSTLPAQCTPPIISYSANWQAPPMICQDSIYNLNHFITGTPGGVWTGQGVLSDSLFDPTGLSGQISLTYSIQPPATCEALPPVVQTKNINVSPVIDPSFSDPGPLCRGGGTFNLNTLVTGTPGGNWTGGNNVNGVINLNNLSGSVLIRYTVGTGACSKQSSRTIEIGNSLPALEVHGVLSYCHKDTVKNLTVDPIPGATVTWYNDSNLTNVVATGNSFLPPISVRPYYVIQVLGTCTSEVTVLDFKFYVVETPTIANPNIYICPGQPVPQITVNSVSNAPVTWYSDSLLTDSIHSGFTYQPENTGEKTFYLTSSGGTCISAPLKIRLLESDLVTAEIKYNTPSLCDADQIVLWSASQGKNSWTGGTTNDTLVVTEPGLYKLTRDGGCNVAVDSIYIPGPKLVTDITLSEDTGKVEFKTSVTYTSIGADECTWLLLKGPAFLDSIISEPTTGELEIAEPGSYKLVLRCSNSGCESETVKDILVYQEGIQIPNVFTPGADQFNDFFKVSAFDIKTIKASIYNRWGKKVYEWDTVDGGWDGYHNGTRMPSGVYFYVVTGTNLLDVPFEHKGSVTLISGE